MMDTYPLLCGQLCGYTMDTFCIVRDGKVIGGNEKVLMLHKHSLRIV